MRLVGTALWFAMSASEEAATTTPDESPDDSTNVPGEYFVQLTEMVDADEVNSTAAKEIIAMLHEATPPRVIAEQRNLLQNSDEDAIATLVDEIMNDPANQQSIDDLRGGNERAIGFLVGQIMKRSGGKANPSLAQKLIRQKL